MRERLESVESTVDDIPQKVSGLAEEMVRLSERVYGVEDRLDAMVSKLDITTESLRADFRLAFERLDGLKQLIERKAAESQAGRAADQSLLYALVKDHNRRLRALERMERRQREAKH